MKVTAGERQPDRDAAGTAAAVPANSGLLLDRIAELELHLRERVEENLILDREVHSLLAELQLLADYVADVEPVYDRVAELEAEHAVVYAELAKLRTALAAAGDDLAAAEQENLALRNRRTLVLVDRLAASVRNHPVLHRLARSVSRREPADPV